jgi:uncharacterized protein (TIGR02996 family)
MTGEQALMQAILEDPEDDLARLVYADWLEENGEQERAEFIRAQVELARFIGDGSDADALARFLHPLTLAMVEWDRLEPVLAERARLRARARELLRNGDTWSVRVEGLENVKFEFTRGFPSRVIVRSLDSFLAQADQVFRAAPVHELEVSFQSLAEVRDLIRSGHLRRISELKVTGFLGEEEGAQMLRLLGESPDVAGVKRLTATGDADNALPLVRALEAGRGWGDLEQLDLEFRRASLESIELDPASARILGWAPHLKNLRDLTLNWFALSSPFAVETLASSFPALESLRLGESSATDEVALALARADLPDLRSLYISRHQFRDPRAAAGLGTSRWPRLVALELSGDMLGQDSLSGLGTALTAGPRRPATLRYLNLRYNLLGPEDAAALARWSGARRLTYLDLARNYWLGSDGASRIAAAHWPLLAYLDLHSCQIGEAGAVALARSTGFPELQWLALDANPLGPGGCKALGRSRQLPHLRLLGLRQTGADKGAKISLRRRFGDALRM